MKTKPRNLADERETQGLADARSLEVFSLLLTFYKNEA